MTTAITTSNDRADFIAAHPDLAEIRDVLVPKINDGVLALNKTLCDVRDGQILAVNLMRETGILIRDYEEQTKVPGKSLTRDLVMQEAQMGLPLLITFEQARYCRQVAQTLTKPAETMDDVREVQRQVEMALGLRSGHHEDQKRLTHADAFHQMTMYLNKFDYEEKLKEIKADPNYVKDGRMREADAAAYRAMMAPTKRFIDEFFELIGL